MARARSAAPGPALGARRRGPRRTTSCRAEVLLAACRAGPRRDRSAPRASGRPPRGMVSPQRPPTTRAARPEIRTPGGANASGTAQPPSSEQLAGLLLPPEGARPASRRAAFGSAPGCGAAIIATVGRVATGEGIFAAGGDGWARRARHPAPPRPVPPGATRPATARPGPAILAADLTWACPRSPFPARPGELAAADRRGPLTPRRARPPTAS